MKKLALSLLFSTALILHNLSPVGSITNLGPVQIITTNGSNEFAAGTVNLNGTINIGQSNTDIITLQGDGITYPDAGFESYIMINENGQIITNAGAAPVTFGSLDAARIPSQTITFGIPSVGNYLHMESDTGNIDIEASATSADLNLSATNNIVLKSANINRLNENNMLILVIDNNGVVKTADSTTSTLLGTLNALSIICPILQAGQTTIGNLIAGNYPNSRIDLGIDNGPNNFFGFRNNIGDIRLEANAIGSNLLLSADSYIKLDAFGLTAPGLLSLDSNNNLITVTNSSAITCGSLIAGANTGDVISLGINDATHNIIAFNSDSGNIEIVAGVAAATLNLTADAGILLNGSELSLTFPAIQSNLDGYVVLAVDRSNNLTTSNSANVFKMGNDNSGNNFIAVDNENTSNGILLNSQAIYLTNQGLAPASGSSNVLTIDSTGKIGIIVSSKAHKDNIKQIKLDESINSLVPVSYSYKGNNHIEYGFIAEDVAEIPSLKHAVIYGQDGKPMSINYQHVFVAVAADHFEVKNEVKTVKEELAEMKNQYKKLEAIVAEMIKQGYLQNPTSTL
jgi:hypothetical protein